MNKPPDISRRQFIVRLLAAMGTVGGLTLRKTPAISGHWWQLDPNKCIQCGKCTTECVLTPSAVKCVHQFEKCGYCDLCSGYFIQNATKLDTGAENQLCPTNALRRKFIEEPYFEYTVDEALCTGCGKCVAQCAAFGNGSLVLQVKHDLCVKCNQCAIAVACPALAFQRVLPHSSYLISERSKKVAE